MKRVIKKNHRRPCFHSPIGLPHLVIRGNKSIMSRTYMFTGSCLYDLKDEDQGDVNKLFGYSLGLHHNNSLRFGWRANLKNATIEIVAYEYHNKVRSVTPICEVKLNEWYTYDIHYNGYGQVIYTVYENNGFQVKSITNPLQLQHKFNIGYTLGLYFGGNEKAPQDITLYKK